MAKKKGIQIDWKELGIKYGDRVGMGVAAFLAVLFIIWGFSSVTSNPLNASQIKEAKSAAQKTMQNFPVKPEALEPANTKKEIKTVDAIAILSESKKKEYPIGTLTTRFPGDYHPPREDISRAKPDVHVAGKMVGIGVDNAYKTTDIHDDGRRVGISVPKEGVKITGGKDANQSSNIRGGKGFGKGPPPPPSGKGKDDKKKDDNAATTADATDKFSYKIIDRKDLKDEDIVAVNLWPTRAAYVIGIYPYGKQIEELNRALKEDSSRISYFKELEIQRRELVLKGTRLADGSVVAEDMVLVPDPSDPSKTIMQPYAKTAVSPMREDEAKAAGWVGLDMELQTALTRFATEFYDEPDPVMKNLIILGGRLNRKIPKMLRMDYPALHENLPELKELVDKIKKDNTPIIPPKRDPRLDKDQDNQFEDEGGSPKPGQPGQAKPAGGQSGGAAGMKGFDPNAGGNQPKSGPNQPKSPDAPAPTVPVDLAGPPEFCVIRFLDLTLGDEKRPVGGRTFEYRVRVVLNNPNYNRKDVAVPEFAKDRELFGDWSLTARVSFPQGYSLYADERQRPGNSKNDSGDLDKVPVQVHKWMGFFEPEVGSGDQKRMGDWWVDRVLAARGEYIGRVPVPDRNRPGIEKKLASLIFWLPFVPEDNDANKMGSESMEKYNTASLITPALLVDFEGGMSNIRTQFRRANERRTVETEDVPAEMLIIEPDGRLVARTFLKDRDDEGRDRRYKRWKKWYDEVAEKTSPKKKDDTKEKKDEKAKPGMAK